MKRKYFKLNMDDVMEIVSEELAASEGFKTFSTKTEIISDGESWYMVVAIGELEDNGIHNINMSELAQKIEYNGTHGNDYWLSDEAMKRTVEGFLKKNMKVSFKDKIKNKLKKIFNKFLI